MAVLLRLAPAFIMNDCKDISRVAFNQVWHELSVVHTNFSCIMHSFEQYELYELIPHILEIDKYEQLTHICQIIKYE